MTFDPPILSEGPLSGAVFVTTHGKILGHDDDGLPLIESYVKYDVTDQFEALVAARLERRPQVASAPTPKGVCGRLLVGQGSDTYDPCCSLPDGHDGGCRP